MKITFRGDNAQLLGSLAGSRADGRLVRRRETIPLVETDSVVGGGPGGANRDTLRLIKFDGVIETGAEVFLPRWERGRPKVYEASYPQLPDASEFFNNFFFGCDTGPSG